MIDLRIIIPPLLRGNVSQRRHRNEKGTYWLTDFLSKNESDEPLKPRNSSRFIWKDDAAIFFAVDKLPSPNFFFVTGG